MKIYAEIITPVCDEHIEFFEAVFVQQHGYSFPGCIFTLFVLRFDPVKVSLDVDDLLHDPTSP